MKTHKILFSLLMGGFSSSLLFYNFNSSNKISLNHKLYKKQSLALHSNLVPNYTPITQNQLNAAKTSLDTILSTGSFAQDFNTQVANRAQNSHTFNIQTLAYDTLLKLNPIYAQINVQFEIAAAQAPSLDWTNQFSYNAANRQLTFTRPKLFKYGLASAIQNQKITFNVTLSAQALTSQKATGTLVIGPFQGLSAMPTSSIPNTDRLTDTISTKYGFLSLYNKNGTAQTTLAFQRKGNIGNAIQTVSISSFYVAAGQSTTKTPFTNDVPFAYLSATNDYIIATAQGNSATHSTYDVNVFYFKISELQNKTAASFTVNAQVLNPKNSNPNFKYVDHLADTLSTAPFYPIKGNGGLEWMPVPIKDPSGNLDGLAIVSRNTIGDIAIFMSKMTTNLAGQNYLSVIVTSQTLASKKNSLIIKKNIGTNFGLTDVEIFNYKYKNVFPGRFIYYNETGNSGNWAMFIGSGSLGSSFSVPFVNFGTYTQINGGPQKSYQYNNLGEMQGNETNFTNNNLITDGNTKTIFASGLNNYEFSIDQVGKVINAIATPYSDRLCQWTILFNNTTSKFDVTTRNSGKLRLNPEIIVNAPSSLYINRTYGVANYASGKAYAVLNDSSSTQVVRLSYDFTPDPTNLVSITYGNSNTSYKYTWNEMLNVSVTGTFETHFNFLTEQNAASQLIITESFAYYKTSGSQTYNYFYYE